MKRTALLAALAAAFAAPAFAAPEQAAREKALEMRAELRHAEEWKRWAEDFKRDMHASMGSLFADRVGSHKVVKNAPYSAEVITESSQPLADGNVIASKLTGRIYRDAQGRTRQESASGEGKQSNVYIFDPVENTSVVLTPGAKKAVKTVRSSHTRDVQRFRVGATDVRIEDGKVFVDGKEAGDGKVEVKSSSGKTVRVEGGRVWIDGKEMTFPGEPGHVVVNRVKGGDGTEREEVRVQIVRAGEHRDHAPVAPTPPTPPTAPAPPIAWAPAAPGSSGAFAHSFPGAHSLRFESTARLGKGVTSSLGARDFDGVRAEGKSTVWTIPAGQIGNRNPINVTSETWYSPELQVTVYSRHNDPRQGETTYRLAQVKRGEPSPELFKVPEDYETKARKR